MTNLPPGFDPGVWGEGWNASRLYAPRAERDCVDGVRLGVLLLNERFEVRHLWAKDGDPAGALFKGTELEAAAFANTYAESHGGWATP